MIDPRPLLCVALLGAACSKHDPAPAADKTSEPAQPAAAPAAPPVPLAADSPIAKAVAAINACDPESGDGCPAFDTFPDVAKDLTVDQYRSAIKLATNRDARMALNTAIAPRIDEALLRDAIVFAEAHPCKDEAPCTSTDDLAYLAGELSPALFRFGMKLAKTDVAKDWLLRGVTTHMDASLVPDIVPLVADEELYGAAQQALAVIENPVALQTLVALLDNHGMHDGIHMMTPGLLAKHPTNPSVRAAVPKLEAMAKHDQNGTGRFNAVSALAVIEGEAAIPFVIEAIAGEADSFYRMQMVTALGTLKANPTAQAALKQLTKDHDTEVRGAAAAALAAKS